MSVRYSPDTSVNSRRSALGSLISVVCPGSLTVPSGCSATHSQNSTTIRNVEIVIKNTTTASSQGDLVVLDQNKSDFFGSDHNTWKPNISAMCGANVRSDRDDEISLKICQPSVTPPENTDIIFTQGEIQDRPRYRLNIERIRTEVRRGNPA